MLTLLGSRFRNCDGISRRNFLQLGAPLLGLGLADVLQLRASAADSDKRAGNKSLIVFWTHGGMSQQDTYDMKPEAPEDIRGAFRPIDTNIPGIQICEKLPRLAQRADRYCVIRSMQTTNGGHDGGMHVAMTGNSRPTADTPYFGSVLAKLRADGHRCQFLCSGQMMACPSEFSSAGAMAVKCPQNFVPVVWRTSNELVNSVRVPVP